MPNLRIVEVLQVQGPAQVHDCFVAVQNLHAFSISVNLSRYRANFTPYAIIHDFGFAHVHDQPDLCRLGLQIIQHLRDLTPGAADQQDVVGESQIRKFVPAPFEIQSPTVLMPSLLQGPHNLFQARIKK
jgi:hypothetical protein